MPSGSDNITYDLMCVSLETRFLLTFNVFYNKDFQETNNPFGFLNSTIIILLLVIIISNSNTVYNFVNFHKYDNANNEYTVYFYVSNFWYIWISLFNVKEYYVISPLHASRINLSATRNAASSSPPHPKPKQSP